MEFRRCLLNIQLARAKKIFVWTSRESGRRPRTLVFGLGNRHMCRTVLTSASRRSEIMTTTPALSCFSQDAARDSLVTARIRCRNCLSMRIATTTTLGNISPFTRPRPSIVVRDRDEDKDYCCSHRKLFEIAALHSTPILSMPKENMFPSSSLTSLSLLSASSEFLPRTVLE